MNLIVAVDKNWGIGYQGDLLAKIPQDQKFFREQTTGKVIIMGRKTLESMPGGRPLPNRLNIVITNQKDYTVKDAIVVYSVQEALEAVQEYKKEDVFVIGGETIYRQMLEHCTVAYVTKIEEKYEADTFFPNLDKLEDWEPTCMEAKQTYQGLEYSFCKYEQVRHDLSLNVY